VTNGSATARSRRSVCSLRSILNCPFCDEIERRRRNIHSRACVASAISSSELPPSDWSVWAWRIPRRSLSSISLGMRCLRRARSRRGPRAIPARQAQCFINAGFRLRRDALVAAAQASVSEAEALTLTYQHACQRSIAAGDLESEKAGVRARQTKCRNARHRGEFDRKRILVTPVLSRARENAGRPWQSAPVPARKHETRPAPWAVAARARWPTARCGRPHQRD
jgi:hypothetical protein